MLARVWSLYIAFRHKQTLHGNSRTERSQVPPAVDAENIAKNRQHEVSILVNAELGQVEVLVPGIVVGVRPDGVEIGPAHHQSHVAEPDSACSKQVLQQLSTIGRLSDDVCGSVGQSRSESLHRLVLGQAVGAMIGRPSTGSAWPGRSASRDSSFVASPVVSHTSAAKALDI